MKGIPALIGIDIIELDIAVIDIPIVMRLLPIAQQKYCNDKFPILILKFILISVQTYNPDFDMDILKYFLHIPEANIFLALKILISEYVQSNIKLAILRYLSVMVDIHV